MPGVACRTVGDSRLLVIGVAAPILMLEPWAVAELTHLRKIDRREMYNRPPDRRLLGLRDNLRHILIIRHLRLEAWGELSDYSLESLGRTSGRVGVDRRA